MTGKIDSYVCGVADAPLLGSTIGQRLDLTVIQIAYGMTETNSVSSAEW